MDVYSRPQRLVRITPKRRLNLNVAGANGPTVVLAAGFLGLTIDWAWVQGFSARFARTVAFDNAGLGFSDPGRGARTSSAIVDDMHAALRQAGLDPPYILVGHSAGGLRIRLFAARYPEEVTGMVMVDTPLADWQERLYGGPSPGLAADREIWRRLIAAGAAGTLTTTSPDYIKAIGLPRADLTPAMNQAMHRMWTNPAYLRTAISESLHLRATTAEEAAADLRSLGDLPLIVLSAGRIGSPIVETDRQRAAWMEMHDEIVTLSTRGQRRMVDSGHNVPIERPRDVVQAIKDVAAMAGA
jgi:pimeloyl-ACP methyl ester carboxylesterase